VNRHDQGVRGRRDDRERLRVTLLVLVPLPEPGEEDQAIVRAMKEVGLSCRALVAGLFVKAIADDSAPRDTSAYRFAARVDLPDHPAVAAPRDPPGHGREISRACLAPNEDRHLVGGRNVITW
jgi:hypothetical protein